MVYKKYVRKNGKLMGPYYYESYREGDKVKKRYLGTSLPNNGLKFSWLIFGIFALLMLSGATYYTITGNSIIFFVGETINQVIDGTQEGSSVEIPVDVEEPEGVLEVPEEPTVEPMVEEPVEEDVSVDAGVDNETIVLDIETEVNDTETENNEIILEGNQTEIIIEDNQTEVNQNDSNLTDVQGGTESEDLGVLVEINETDFNQTIETNITANISLVGNGSFNVETKSYKVVLNRPVKWVKKVQINYSDGLEVNVELPKDAKNISVKTGEEVGKIDGEIEDYNNVVERTDKKDILSGGLTGNVVSDIADGRGVLFKFFNWFGSLTITGNVVLESDLEQSNSIVQTENSTIVDVDGAVGLLEGEVAVEYYTDAPTALEEETENGKTITITGPDDVHYEEILSYTELPESFGIVNESQIVLRWQNTGENMEFDLYDTDENGIYDYIEWITPHLSEQTFEIILITDAQRLDADRGFIENVYSSVSELDGVSASISDGEYLRVRFERNLTSEKDITIYARTQSENARIEVYEKDGNESLIVFDNFPEMNDKEYKLYLTNLSGEQDEFDLLSVGDFEYDYVVDPMYLPNDTGTGVLGEYYSGTCSSGELYTWDSPPDGSYSVSALENVSSDDSSFFYNTLFCPTDYKSGSQFIFNISEGVSTITSLNVTAIQSLSASNGLDSVANLFVYIGNVSSAQWYLLDSLSSPVNETFYTQSGVITSGISDFVNETSGGNFVYVLLFANGSNDDYIYHHFDYVGLNITATDPYSITSCPWEITSSGEYTLAGDLTSIGTCINVTANDVVIDGQGFSITGDGSGELMGVKSLNVLNLTINDLELFNFDYGVYVNVVSNLTLENITIYNSTSSGVYSSQADSMIVTNSNITNNLGGGNIYHNGADGLFEYNDLGNTVGGTGIQIANLWANNNIIRHNKIYSVSYGVYLNHATGHLVWNNTINNSVDSGIAVSDGGYSKIYDNYIENSGNGMYLMSDASGYSEIVNNTIITSTDFGIYLESGNGGYNTIRNNIIRNSGAVGISVSGVGNNVFEDNTIEYSSSVGVIIGGANSNNTLINTTLNSNYQHLYVSGGAVNVTDIYAWNCTNTATSGGCVVFHSIDGNILNGGVINYSTDADTLVEFTASAYNNISNIVVSNSAGNGIGIILNDDSGDFIRGYRFDNVSVFGSAVYGIDMSSAIQDVDLINSSFDGYYFSGNDLGNNVTFENEFGALKFYSELSGSGLNLSYDIQIGNNSAFVNSSQVGLNKSANVTLYGIGDRGFSNPQILKDGVICSDCWNFTALNADTVVFNVSSWSEYTIGDDAFPLVSITYPISGELYNSITALNYTASDTNLQSCWYSLDLGITNVSVGTCGNNLTSLTSIEGENTWTIWAKDTSGNENTSAVVFTKETGSSVTICRTLDSENTVYTLQNDITATGNCFIIGANNVTLDMNGKNVSYVGMGLGVSISGYNSSTIENGIVDGFTYGIYATGSLNTTLSNLTITRAGSIGVNLIGGSSNSNLVNLIVDDDTTGISISSSSNNILTNITVNNNDVTGLYYENSNNNNITNLAYSGGNNGIVLISSSNNLFQESEDVSTLDFLLIGSTNNVILNMSYSTESVDGTSQLIRKGYYKAFVNDTLGVLVSGANVTAYNITNAYQFNLTTDETGYTQLGQVIDYINVGSIKTYYSPYTIYATNSSYKSISHSFNASLGSDLEDVFMLDGVYPSVSVTYPTSGITYGSVSALNYTVSDTNLQSCWYSLNSGGTNTSVTCGNNLTSLTPTEGSNTWKVWANDTVNNINSSSVTFSYDGTAPEVTISSPSGTYATASYSIDIGINENGTCEYSLDYGVTNVSLTGNASGTGFTGSGSGSNGGYVLTAYCNDTLGNLNNTVNSSFSIAVPATVVEDDGGGGSLPPIPEFCNPVYSYTPRGVCVDGVRDTIKHDNTCGGEDEIVERICSIEICVPDFVCSNWGSCFGGKSTRECVDESLCGGEARTEEKSCAVESCEPNVECGDFGVCGYTDSVENLLKGEVMKTGIQKRECVDNNGCLENSLDGKECVSNFEIELLKEDVCGEERVIAFNKNTEEPITDINLETWGRGELDITFIQDKTVYCSSCYNGFKDVGETGVDCGGECKSCALEFRGIWEWPYWSIIFWWALGFLVPILLILLFLLRKKSKKKSRK